MNGRKIVWLALFILGAVAVLTAVSTAADPADINNPPTQDWFFDSGSTVTIADRTWDINYNITVANYTTLAFDNCVFTFSDPSDLYSRWIYVMWNGSLIVNDCTFKSTGNMKYYLLIQNTTVFRGSTIGGMLPRSTNEGGITAWDSDITFENCTLQETIGYHALKTYECQVTLDTVTVTKAGSEQYGRAAVYLEWMYTSGGEHYTLNVEDCTFTANEDMGLYIRQYRNYAEFDFDFTGTTFRDNNDWGFRWNWEYGYNSTLIVDFTDCTFEDNRYGGFHFYNYRQTYDGTGVLNFTFTRCTFDGNNDGGVYFDIYYTDASVNLVFVESTFRDNGLTPTGWDFGGLYIYNSRFYRTYTLDIDDCVFDNNAAQGLRLFHRSTMEDGNWISIEGTQFTDNRDYGIILYMDDYYDHFADLSLDSCTFMNNGDAAFYIEQQNMWYHDYDLSVVNCTFNGDGSGVVANSFDWSDGPGDIHWAFDSCTFQNLDGKAISLYLVEVSGDTSLMVDSCDFTSTGGISYKTLGSLSDVQPYHMLELTDVDISDTTDSGVDAHMVGYYGVEFDVYVKDVTITTAMFNGIKATSSTDYGSASATIDMDITIMNVDISAIGGNGLNLGNERVDYAGTRTIDVNGLTIANVQKAMVISSLKGEFRDTTLTGSLKQDLTVITSDLELFQPTLDALTGDNVQVIESGSVKFWYSLKVFINWDTGNAVEGAVVEITDNQHTLIGVFTQYNESGLPELLLNSFQFRETGQFTRSPYVLNVTFRNIQKVVPVNLDGDKDVTIELADHSPPNLFINEPMVGHIQREMDIFVRGSSFDAESGVDMVEVSLDGVEWVQTENTLAWSHMFTVTLQDVIDSGGVFTVRARATDLAGNSASEVTSLEIDPFPPELRVDHPYDGLQTNDPDLVVRGVTERGASVMVNGEEVEVLGTLFTAHVQLVEGPNTITVDAFDALGNSKQVKMEVVLDTKPPYLVWLTPEDGEMFTEPTATVAGQAEDDLTIMVDGNMLGDVHYNNGTFEYAVSLTRGDNMITLEAMDRAGNKIMLMRTVELDDVPPILAIQSPIDGSHQNTMTIEVVGTTDEDADLLINGELVDLDHGLFAYSFVGVEGENTILVAASDTAGNLVSVSLTVIIDTEDPVFVVSSPPEEGSMVTEPSYTISGTSEGANWVWINGERHDVETDGSFSVTVTLLEGENRFIITFEDMAGNSVTVNRYVTLDTTPPVMVIRIPDMQVKDGTNVFKTKKGKPSIMTITGFTDKGVQVRVSGGDLVPISADGYFVVDYLLNVNQVNTITITATDEAGNMVSQEIVVEHQHLKDPGDEFDWGLVILLVGIILLALAIFVGWRRLSAHEEEQEIEVEEEEVLAPAAMPEVEEELELEEEEEEILIEEDDEEIHELTPPEERPRTDTSRPAYEGAEEEVTIEIDEKDLEEKDAEGDVEADELEQEEGI